LKSNHEYVIDSLISHYVEGTLNPAASLDAIRVVVSRCHDYYKYQDDNELSLLIETAKRQAQDILFKKAHEAISLLSNPMTMTQVSQAAQLVHPVIISDIVIKLLRALKEQEKGSQTLQHTGYNQIPATLQIIMEQYVL